MKRLAMTNFNYIICRIRNKSNNGKNILIY